MPARRSVTKQSSFPRPDRRAGFALALLSTLSLIAVPPAAGQSRPGVLELIVLDGERSEPLANVQVLLDGRAAGVTDAAGFVRLASLQPTEVSLILSLIGYQAMDLAVGISEGETTILTIPLEIEPVVVSGVQAEVEKGFGSRQLVAFYERVRTGTGQYITREEIERRRPGNLSELMRSLPGIGLTTTAGGDRPMVEARTSAVGDLLDRGSPDCAIQYFIDGTPIKPIHDGVIGAEVSINEIEGIEIYRRGSTVPSTYSRLKNNCGVILIWKKERE
jgi:hypothetical protein